MLFNDSYKNKALEARNRYRDGIAPAYISYILDEQYKELRDNIENILSILPENVAIKIIANFVNNTMKFDKYYHELITMSLLRDRGLTIIDYEPLFNNKTPDLLVQDKNDKIVVEIVTPDFFANQSKIIYKFLDLKKRIEEIKIGAFIDIQRADDTIEKSSLFDSVNGLDQSVNKIIAKHVNDWLTMKPNEGTMLEYLDLSFTLFQYVPDKPHAVLMNIPLPIFSYGEDEHLREVIKNKMSKYKEIVLKNSLSFYIIVVIDDFIHDDFIEQYRGMFKKMLEEKNHVSALGIVTKLNNVWQLLLEHR